MKTAAKNANDAAAIYGQNLGWLRKGAATPPATKADVTPTATSSKDAAVKTKTEKVPASKLKTAVSQPTAAPIQKPQKTQSKKKVAQSK